MSELMADGWSGKPVGEDASRGAEGNSAKQKAPSRGAQHPVCPSSDTTHPSCHPGDWLPPSLTGCTGLTPSRKSSMLSSLKHHMSLRSPALVPVTSTLACSLLSFPLLLGAEAPLGSRAVVAVLWCIPGLAQACVAGAQRPWVDEHVDQGTPSRSW